MLASKNSANPAEGWTSSAAQASSPSATSESSAPTVSAGSKRSGAALAVTHDVVEDVAELLVEAPRLTVVREDLEVDLRAAELPQRVLRMLEQAPTDAEAAMGR